VAFGAGLIIGSESAELYSPKVVSASSGYLFRAKIKQVEAIPGEINDLRAHSFAVWGADNTGEDIGKIKETPSRIALVIGHEAFGLADDVAQKLDKTVRIPISAHVDSLSAPVAGSILLQRISERMGILK
jgi:TrmH family RNA methyltransferase